MIMLVGGVFWDEALNKVFNPFILRAAKKGLTVLEIFYIKKHSKRNVDQKSKRNVDQKSNNNSPSNTF